MNSPSDLLFVKCATRCVVAAVIAGIASLVLPWWNLIFTGEGNFNSTFSLFLWGVVKTGFYKASIPIEWWSYTTFALVAIGTLLSLGGYRLLATNKRNAKRLLILDSAFTACGVLFYLFSLRNAFANLFPRGYQDSWIINFPNNNSVLKIWSLDVFKFEDWRYYQIYEFLSLGFILAVIALGLSIFAILMLLDEPHVKTLEKSGT